MATTREVRLPRRLWVGTYEFPFGLVFPIDPLLDGADGITYTDEGERGIFVANNLDARKTLEVVWHEVTHAINWVNDIEDGATEEAAALAHGRAWTQFLLDNPRFQRWLTHTINRIRKEQSNA